MTFVGDAPRFLYDYTEERKHFGNVTATVYYPAGNDTWTEEVRGNYGGNLTWVAYDSSLTSESGDVTVENSGSTAWGSGVTLVVEPMTDDILDDSTTASKGIVKYTAYDITLMKDNQEIQPDGSVRVRIAVPEGYDGTKCVIYHMDAKGNLEKIACTYEDGWLVFTTDHFSTYIVAETTASASVKGDMNGDGEVTLKDVTKLFQFVNKQITTLGDADGDMNGDGEVTLKDVTRLFQFVNKQIDKL